MEQWGKGKQDTLAGLGELTEAKEDGGLGFKDLEAFNLALLWKQVWRLITKPNLLMSRGMKSKYFSNSSIFQAKNNSRDSWFWQSWNGAKVLLMEGCSWLVENGASINIWEDKWLNGEGRDKLRSAKPVRCTVQKVKYLLNRNFVGWNEGLLKHLFSDDEVQAIKRIPIRSFRLADRLV